jgi:hypothetical protein
MATFSLNLHNKQDLFIKKTEIEYLTLGLIVKTEQQFITQRELSFWNACVYKIDHQASYFFIFLKFKLKSAGKQGGERELETLPTPTP